MSGLRRRIGEIMDEMEDTVEDAFLPHSSMKSLVTETTVTEVLTATKGISKEKITELVAFICEPHGAMRVFVILLWTGQVRLMEAFYECRFIDSLLPVYKDHGKVKTHAFHSLGRDAIDNLFSENMEEYTIDFFCDNAQWKFLAPVFREKQFKYNFHPKCPMPYLTPSLDRKTGYKDSHFSLVEQRCIHKDHLIRGSNTRISLDQNGHPIVAFKQLRNLNWSEKDFQAAAETEADVLEMIRDFNHPHLIRAIASYTRGNTHHLILPWANGGNLRDFWESENPWKVDAEFFKWAFEQLCGLAGAIEKLHSTMNTCRHGDLKPENILCFENTGHSRPRSQPWLVIADVGLAKIHNQATHLRHEATRTLSGTVMYEPPEAVLAKYEPRSRRYDVWSIGCIYLEFLIWILFGKDQLNRFENDITSAIDGNRKFFEVNTGIAGIKTAVQKWIDSIRADRRVERNTAVRRLLDLICNRLLVVAVGNVNASYSGSVTQTTDVLLESNGLGPEIVRTSTSGMDTQLPEHINYRATAKEVYEKLKAIRKEASGSRDSKPKLPWMNFKAPRSGGPKRYGSTLAPSQIGVEGRGRPIPEPERVGDAEKVEKSASNVEKKPVNVDVTRPAAGLEVPARPANEPESVPPDLTSTLPSLEAGGETGEDKVLDSNPSEGVDDVAIDDIESILSDDSLMPSLTTGSTASSIVSQALTETIVHELLAMFRKDEEMSSLLGLTPRTIDADKFQRNFRRLIKRMAADMRDEFGGADPEIRQAVRALKRQAPNIAAHVFEDFFQPNLVLDFQAELASRDADYGERINAFLIEADDVRRTTVDIKEPEGFLHVVDSSSSGSDSDSQPPHSYDRIKALVASSASYSKFKSQYREIFNPSSKQFDPKDENTLEIEPAGDIEDVSLQDHEIRNWARWDLPRLWEEATLISHSFMKRCRKSLRPKVRVGYERLEWTCDCGEDLYADFDTLDPDSIQEFRRFLKLEFPQHRAVNRTSIQSTQCDQDSQHHSPSASRSPNATPLTPIAGAGGGSGRQNLSLGSRALQKQQAHTGLPAQSKALDSAPARRRFLELCVNVGNFEPRLAEIDASHVENDSQLFTKIRETYHEVRGYRNKLLLRKPVDVHFVQFSLDERHRAGVYKERPILPDQGQMSTKGYHYSPCPMKPAQPIPIGTFLHYFLVEAPGAHKGLKWGGRMPHKVDASIHQDTDVYVVGWGIHVIEGLNKLHAIAATLCIVLISGVISIVWTVVKKDTQGGFGIGSWIASVLATILMLVLAKWNEI